MFVFYDINNAIPGFILFFVVSRDTPVPQAGKPMKFFLEFFRSVEFGFRVSDFKKL